MFGRIFALLFVTILIFHNCNYLYCAKMEDEEISEILDPITTETNNIIAKLNINDVCVIGFNAGRGNSFLHIKRTGTHANGKHEGEITIADCGKHKTSILNIEVKIDKVIEAFLTQGYQLKYVLISHGHADHMNLLKNIKLQKETIIIQNSNMIPKNSQIKEIPITSRGSEKNAQSLVVSIDGVIYMGDINSGTPDFSSYTDEIIGIVFPHHGSITHDSRKLRNEIIEQASKVRKPRFIIVSNNNLSSCKFYMSENTVIACSDEDYSYIFTNDDKDKPQLIDIKKAKSLPEGFIVTGSDQNILGHVVIFNPETGTVKEITTIKDL